MTEASVETYAQWSEPDKQQLQKTMLTLIHATPGLTCNAIYETMKLGHATGSSRLQSIKDMGLIEAGGKTTEHKGERKVTLSLFVLTPLGMWLMGLPPHKKDEVLSKMQKVLAQREEERAQDLKAIRREYLHSLRDAIGLSAKEFGWKAPCT